jgi:hypothetical protein
MNACSEDLRKKFVEALQRGMGKLRQDGRGGPRASTQEKPGSKPKLDERAPASCSNRVSQALSAINPKDVRSFFEHVGYRPVGQLL